MLETHPTHGSLGRAAPEPRRVLLTGASGFVGREILRQLLASGREVVAISRHPRAETVPPGVIQVAADITGEGWLRWCDGCGAAIHLVGIIREVRTSGVTFERAHRIATERVIAGCKKLGIRRLLHMSALGSRAGAATPYHRTKWQAEEAVRASGLEWTIFRPAPIFGPGDGFSTSIAAAMRRIPVFPVFGDGTTRLQPIAVDEVAHCFVNALELRGTAGQSYDLGGPEALSYDEVLRRIARALGLRRMLLHLPVGLSRLLVSAVQHLPNAPITLDQLTMLLEGSTCDASVTAMTVGVPSARFVGPVWMKKQGPGGTP